MMLCSFVHNSLKKKIIIQIVKSFVVCTCGEVKKNQDMKKEKERDTEKIQRQDDDSERTHGKSMMTNECGEK